MIVEEKKAADNLCVRGGSTFPSGCQGSRCMAWRWVNPLDEEYDYLFNDAPDREKTYGYCGLAGRP